MKISFLKLFVLFFLVSFSNSQGYAKNPVKVKNIIFLIGDGMGEAQIFAAMTRAGYPLNIEKFPYTGYQKTFSLTDYITDSAAGGTALASGQKTVNGFLGQDTLGNKFKSILTIAGENGLATGIVVSSSITHATPAAFYSYQPDRSMYEEIAMDFINSGIDVAIGGGFFHFYKRADSLNLLDSLRVKGYSIVTNNIFLQTFEEGKLAALFYPVHPPSMKNGRENLLPDGTAKAIELLKKNEKGFFLMVEGSQIDWSGHDNDLEGVIDEMLDFDKAVGVALDFAREDGNTLVVVTSDHETGGLTIVGGSIENKEVIAIFATDDHTAALVPVFSYGPGAEQFTGILDNTEFFGKFLRLYGFSD